jgi:hypothetical protein
MLLKALSPICENMIYVNLEIEKKTFSKEDHNYPFFQSYIDLLSSMV